MVFLIVALDEGLGVNEYARRFGIDRRDMSHYLSSIGGGGNYRSKFYGLVTFRKSPTNKSGKRVILTKKGKKLFDKLNYA
jgi:DNA-binding MarR family transcriptional regulator